MFVFLALASVHRSIAVNRSVAETQHVMLSLQVPSFFVELLGGASLLFLAATVLWEFPSLCAIGRLPFLYIYQVYLDCLSLASLHLSSPVFLACGGTVLIVTLSFVSPCHSVVNN